MWGYRCPPKPRMFREEKLTLPPEPGIPKRLPADYVLEIKELNAGRLVAISTLGACRNTGSRRLVRGRRGRCGRARTLL